MSKIFNIILFLAGTQVMSAQDTSMRVTWGGFSTVISSHGGLGTPNRSAIEFPPNTGNFALTRMAFWVTGITGGDTLAVTEDVFGTESSWFNGPLGNSGMRHLSPAQWPGFFSVDRSEVNYHKANYKNNSYVITDNIRNWPGSLTVNGFPKILAPFADVNQNNKYDPVTGDYPYVPGIYHVFTAGSDSLNPAGFRTLETNLDVTVMWYNTPDADSLPGVLFYRATICNRSANTYPDLTWSMAGNMRIGDPLDDYLATEVRRNALLSYNAPGVDNVYGTNAPVVAMGFLSSKAKSSMWFDNSADAVFGAPKWDKDFYHLAHGYWKTGKFLVPNNSGLDGSSDSTRFIYSRGTDPNINGKYWSEESAPNTPGSRTAVISGSAFSLSGQDCKVIDGFVTLIPGAPDTTAQKNWLDKIIQWYDKQEYTLHSDFKITLENKPYPNPAKTSAIHTIPGAKSSDMVRIFDQTGRLVLHASYGEGLCLNLPAGVYLVKLDCAGYCPAYKLMINQAD